MKLTLPTSLWLFSALKKLIVVFFAFTSINFTAHAQEDIRVPAENIKLGTFRSFKNTLAPLQPLAVDPEAVYSNISNNTGGALNVAVASNSTPKRTALIADSIRLTGTPPYTISKVTVVPANTNANIDMNVTVGIRFYQNNAGVPGTYIGGYTSTVAYTFPAGGQLPITFTLPSTMTVTAQTIWAGIVFNTTNSSPVPAQTDLVDMGIALFNPPNVGTSGDNIFRTSTAGDFAGSNPTGTLLNGQFGGSPVTNAGWELVQAAPVPVGIEYLRGMRNNNSHQLSWKVNAVNSAVVKFQIERSADNRNFAGIYAATVDAQQCAAPFTFNDAQPLPGVNFYRLKVTDIDGKTSYSAIITVLNKTAGFELISVTPNPVMQSGLATVNISSAVSGTLEISVYDQRGLKVIAKSEKLIAGNNTINLNTAILASGAYTISCATADGSVKNIQFIK
ncbi:hypothetical protein BH09BAC2_BH09BAC2_16090 [soil metagenome]